MSDYPPTPSFGERSGQGQSAPQYYEPPPIPRYDKDEVVSEGRQIPQYMVPQNLAAFQQNANIPGFSRATLASGIPPLPIHNGFETHGYQYIPESSIQRVVQDSSRPIQSPIGYSQHVHRPPYNPPLDVHHTPNSQAAEEGELSEGEFEDSPLKTTPNVTHAEYGAQDTFESYHDWHNASIRQPVNPGKANDAYLPTESLTDAYGRSLDLHRQRSDSYSPRPARVDLQYGLDPPSKLKYQESHTNNNDQFRSQKSFDLAQIGTQEQNRPSGWSLPPSQDTSAQSYGLNRGDILHTGGQSSDLNNSSPGAKSLIDARKEAQGAILNLMPLKVQYQNYIEEGIDPVVVRRQFEAIGLPPPPSISSMTKVDASSAISSNQKHSTAGSTSDSLPGEERKDRIARLLAKRNGKISSSSTQLAPSDNSFPIEDATPIKPTPLLPNAAKADRERMLRLKMEALTKSREQRAQKAASKTSTSQPTSPANFTASTISAVVAQDQPTIISGVKSKSPTRTPPPSQIQRPSIEKNSIPGLFLSSSTITTSAATTGVDSATAQVTNHRKRPVASDFDALFSSVPAYKRPFGQNRNDQPLVIDVSDDESNDGLNEMTVDYPLSDDTTLLAPRNGVTTPKASSMRDLPPLSDFPTRRPFPASSSAVSTPPMAQIQNKPLVSTPVDLHQKEIEIDKLKRKIAEAVRRKKAKEASSGSQTPARDETKSFPLKSATTTIILPTAKASVQLERLMDTTSRQVNENQLKLVEAHVAEQTKAEDLKRAEVERRRLRRAEIASDLPAVDAEVEKGQRRLADLMAEMAQLEAAVQQGLKQKQLLADEMERLGQEVDEQLQVHKAKLHDLIREEDSSTEAILLPTEDKIDHPLPIRDATTSPAADADITKSDPNGHLNTSPGANEPQPSSPNAPNERGAEAYAVQHETTTTSAEIDTEHPSHSHSLVGDTGPPVSQDLSATELTTDQALEAALQDSTPADTEELAETISNADIENIYAPDPDELAPVWSASPVSHSQPDDSLLLVDSDRPADDAESDIYEPPEATPTPMDISSTSNSPPFSPAPPDVDSKIEKPGSQPKDSIVSKVPLNTSKLLIPLGVDIPSQTEEGIEDLQSKLDPEFSFTAYDSPLKYFRAYRYHPGFENEVAGSFRSLTYSNNIKADTEICRYELAGGVCNDQSCEFQHFKIMGLADDAIITELGNVAGYSAEERNRFVSGLRTVLQELRANSTRDFQAIASCIAAYRSKFLGDKSRVLPLDGVSV